uniref:zinc finger protein 568-like n=1 Tax=Doryrhamphus excisus TaxID=161450 RepID=UPI0025ADA03B|nr:zinc finger protein 568-like [Doryrhamphus excisus]
MFKVQMLKSLVNQRLTAAVEEIFVVFEKTIAEYEEELSRTKVENERQRQLLDAFYKTQVVVHRADVIEGDPPAEKQDWSTWMAQKEHQSPHIKEEEEDHSISQEGEHLEELEEFLVIRVPVKSEDDEDEGHSQEMREAEPPCSSSAHHMTAEVDGDHCSRPQADNTLGPLSDSDDTTSHSPNTDDDDDDDDDAKVDRTCHTDNTHRKCSQCNKTFKCRSNLKIHMRTHTGEKPYICSVCGKSYSQKIHLTIHTRTHTGEKPFSCSVCGIGFERRDKLKTHSRIHTGEKPFSCSVCGTGFARNQDLKRHTRIHTGEKPFSCSVCGINFVRTQDLKRHMRIHTGENPFSCSFCNKSFCDRTPLVRHMRIHTGEKVFSCSVCGERFSYKYQVNNHKCAGENSSGT